MGVRVELFDELDDVRMFDPTQDRDFALDRLLPSQTLALVYDLQRKLKLSGSVYRIRQQPKIIIMTKFETILVNLSPSLNILQAYKTA